MTASRLVLQSVRFGGGWAGLLAVTSLLQAATATVLPAVLGRAVDGVLRGSATSTWPAVYAALVAVSMSGDALSELAVGASTANATARLRHLFLRRVLGLGTSSGLSAGDMTSRAVTATADTAYAPSASVLAVTAIVPPVGGMVALILLDPWLALTFALGLPAIIVLLRSFVRDTSTVVGRYLEAQGRIASRLVETLGGNRTIGAAGTAEHEVGRVLEPLPELSEHGHAIWRIQAAVSGRGTLAIPLLQIAVLTVAGFELAAGRLTAGGLLAATQYSGLGADIGPVIAQLGRLARARAGASRLAPVLDRPAPAYGSASLPPGTGRLEFRGVSSGEVLEGLDLVVPGGGSVAVVGRSGSGKSLLAALAGRLSDPDVGQVLLDGVPLPELDRPNLRGAVGYAFARPALFGATIADAIGGDAVVAARAACADPFIRRLTDGYRTPPAETPLSGGELQRLGLARAFAHPGRVLILDDATSSLDTVTEVQIGDALTHDPRTRLIIAHRAGTAARADRVAWLDGGRIRACAPHHELWSDPAYREVFRE
jgi:ATP-binding cassette subfamily B protein